MVGDIGDLIEHECCARAALVEDYEKSFDIRWKADLREIKMWQKATGKKLIWPDHTDLCVWLLGQLDEQNDHKM